MPGFEIFGEEERRAVAEVMETGVLMRYGFDAARKDRWKARQLEEMLRQRLQTPHAHACASGTAAVLSALICAGIGAGDEVIVPPFTFVADIEAVLYAGATPIFADIDETLCLNPDAVAQKITPRTKAVLLVHMCGSMGKVEEMQRLCCAHRLLLIEDVAQAIGASYHGRPLGTFGIAGCFSFDYVKTVTCGEGGAVITCDNVLYDHVQAFTDHGHAHQTLDRGVDPHRHMGLNFRISELHAAIGVAQLGKLDRMLEIQRAHKAILQDAVGDLPGLRLRGIPDPHGDSATFFSFFLPDADATRAAAKALAEAGVDGCFYWFANNWHYHTKWEHLKQFASINQLHIARLSPPLEFTDPSLPDSDALMARLLSLQIRLSWTEQQCRERAARLRAALSKVL